MKKPFRKRRMANFLNILDPQPTDKILDIGGTSFNWNLIENKFDVVLLNTKNPELTKENQMSNYSYVKGDATDLHYDDNSFDICFSNSVIEHVGSFKDQQLFAKEISRVGKRIWLQTPAKSFFFDPHYFTPFIHWFPKGFQRKIARYFTIWGLFAKPSKQRVNGFIDFIRMLTYKELKGLFPDCIIKKERFLFMTKAYLVIKM